MSLSSISADLDSRTDTSVSDGYDVISASVSSISDDSHEIVKVEENTVSLREFMNTLKKGKLPMILEHYHSR